MNSTDATQGNLLWQDDGEAEVDASPNDSESDLYHDSLTSISQDILIEHMSDVDDEDFAEYCDVHAVGQQSTVRRLFTAVAMQRNNGSDQHFLCGPFQ
jgi:hypothetical protein